MVKRYLDRLDNENNKKIKLGEIIIITNESHDRNNKNNSDRKRGVTKDDDDDGNGTSSSSDDETKNPKKNPKIPRRNPKRNPKKNPQKKKPDEDDPDFDPLKILLEVMNEERRMQRDGVVGSGKKPNVSVTTEIICKNPLCNHKTLEEDPTPIEPVNMTTINNIDDLIKLGRTFHCKKNREYNGINLRLLCNLITPLNELKNMIGMKAVKQGMVNQILFFLQGFNKSTKCNSCVDCSFNLPCAISKDDMLHTVITGPPGVGKTELGKILAKVYKEMGVLSKGDFHLVSRSDLVAKYLGQTAIKTQQKIDECMGGVMFIDEAYALGHVEGRDSFSKECLDTLNQNLSEKRDFLCIIAGYKDALEECFFSMNDGLRRRFTFRYDIDKYDAKELKAIFELKIRKDNWIINLNSEDEERLQKFFSSNANNFPNYGGDIETLFLKCKICHARRALFGDISNRRILTISDIENGFKLFLEDRKYTDDGDDIKNHPPMYM